jgi:hypothetical protein
VKHARILVHAFVSLLPTLGGRWLVREMAMEPDEYDSCSNLALLVFGAIAFVPFLTFFAAVTVRHFRFPRGDR